MDDTDEAARRIVEHDPYFPKNDEWNDDLTFDARIVARAYLDLRARMVRDGAGWQPIETAPKDGTPINVARYNDTFGWVRGWATWADIRGIYGWISRGFFSVPGELGLANPTHWQPLPAPPAKDQT